MPNRFASGQLTRNPATGDDVATATRRFEDEIPAEPGLDNPEDTARGVDEGAALEAARGDHKIRVFYRLWALKEALIKALGTGFSLHPSRFEVPSNMIHGVESGEFRFPHAPADRWQLTCLPAAGYSAAIAWEVDAGRR